MNQKITSIVILGTGSIGSRHLRVFRSIPGVRPIAVSTRPGRAAALRAEGYEARETLSEALAERPAGVLVATDTGRHEADAIASLAVCDVLVEKPLAPRAEAGRAIAAAARAAGRRAHVACCLRFDAGLRWLRERLPALGSLYLADVECLSWLPSWRPGREVLALYAAREGEGGVLLDLVHEIDYSLWLFGPARRITARLENHGAVGLPPSVEETACLISEHADGLTVTTRLSYAVRAPSRRLRVFGRAGTLEWDGVARQARRLDSTGAEAESASLRGEATELVDVETGALAVATCDAARRAAWTSRWEPIEHL
jgi:predicted dehydrogenase